MVKKRKKGAHKSSILSCVNDEVVARDKIKADGSTIRKGAKGKILKQRRTKHGFVRAKVDFRGQTVEVAKSKLKCAK